MWNNFFFPSLMLMLVLNKVLLFYLSTLYLFPLFYIFEKYVKNIKIPVSFLLFVDDILLISQEKSLEKTSSFLFYSYNIVFSLLDQFGLVIEHGKTEVFYFSKSHSTFNLFPLDLSIINSSILSLKSL